MIFDIVNLTDDFVREYVVCLEDWQYTCNMIFDPRPQKKWIQKKKKQGLQIKLAISSTKRPIGMIEYLPIEYSRAKGDRLFFINCLWVHGYEKGVGNNQGKGIGTSLLRAAENDAKNKGAIGMAAGGNNHRTLSTWYKGHGYSVVDSMVDLGAFGLPEFDLLWRPFKDSAVPPQWYRRSKQLPRVRGKVTLNVFNSGWCPGRNYLLEGAVREAMGLGPMVAVNYYDTSDPMILREWGISDGLFIDGKSFRDSRPERMKAALMIRLARISNREKQT